MSLKGCGNPPAMNGKTTSVKVTCECDECKKQWEEDQERGTGEVICPIEGCGSVITVFKQTPLSPTVGINHYKCPKKHACPDECDQHFPECVLDIPYIKGPPECVCPACGANSPMPMGICQKDDKCWVKVICAICAKVYLCEPSEGEVCPHCCGSSNLVEVLEVDANGDPTVTDGQYTTWFYCKICKKGAPGKPSSSVSNC